MGALAMAAFFLSCFQRLPSPTELGSGEGSLMDHAIRLAAGQPLYAAPSLGWIPLAYMPGMPMLAAVFFHFLGPQFWVGRAIDMLAAAGLCAIFVASMKRETGRWSPGIAAAGIFLLGQGFTLGCYDVFRPDIPMLCLAFAGAATLRFSTAPRGAILSALLFSIAFVFKQHGLVFGLVMLPYLFFADRRRLPAYALSLALFAGGGFVLLRLWFGPWFPFYVYDVPSHWSHVSRQRIEHYISQEAFGRFAMLTVPATLALALRPLRERWGIWWWLALAGAGTGLMATLDPYAFLHTLVPGFCAFSFVGLLSLHRLGAELPEARRLAFGWATAAVVLVQIVALPFSPRVLRPHAGAGAALDEFLVFLRAQPAVSVVFHGYYTHAAGKGTGLSILPLDDVIRARGNSLLRRDPAYFERMFAPLRRGPNRPVIVSDTTLAMIGDASRPYWASLSPGFRLSATLGSLSRRLSPVVGAHDTPRYVYTPVEPESAAAR